MSSFESFPPRYSSTMKPNPWFSAFLNLTLSNPLSSCISVVMTVLLFEVWGYISMTWVSVTARRYLHMISFDESIPRPSLMGTMMQHSKTVPEIE